jgi:hypothetical protein
MIQRIRNYLELSPSQRETIVTNRSRRRSSAKVSHKRKIHSNIDLDASNSLLLKYVKSVKYAMSTLSHHFSCAASIVNEFSSEVDSNPSFYGLSEDELEDSADELQTETKNHKRQPEYETDLFLSDNRCNSTAHI